MKLRTRVKICGMTRSEDAAAACQLGVDAIGLVFYGKSPRNVSIQQASSICESVSGFVSVVALFLNAETDLIRQVVNELPVDLIQFHGTEPPEFCRSFGKPYLKALGTEGESDLVEQIEAYGDARGILLDSHGKGAAGGTGATFDWGIIPAHLSESIILAGGLNPKNVAEAIRTVRPYGVDLSSGVEAGPGIKNAKLMAQLMKEVKRVDCEHENKL